MESVMGLSKNIDDTSAPSSNLLVGYTGNSYELLNPISRGSYGMVYKARNVRTGQFVAVKHEFHGTSQSTHREVQILDSLPPHPSIVELKDVIVDYNSDRVFVVMEYLNNDLYSFMQRRAFTLTQVKCVMKHILEGVALLHDEKVMHRDLKPSNILIDGNKDMLKICDFGLSRYLDKPSGSHYSPKVATLYYRAPELLLGAKDYSYAIDMWSLGCIMGELLTGGDVLFKGSCEIDQLVTIYKVLGMPNDVTWPGFSRLPGSLVFVDQPDNLLGSKLAPSMVTACGLDLIQKLLTYDPTQRIMARAALDHAWFTE